MALIKYEKMTNVLICECLLASSNRNWLDFFLWMKIVGYDEIRQYSATYLTLLNAQALMVYNDEFYAAARIEQPAK